MKKIGFSIIVLFVAVTTLLIGSFGAYYYLNIYLPEISIEKQTSYFIGNWGLVKKVVNGEVVKLSDKSTKMTLSFFENGAFGDEGLTIKDCNSRSDTFNILPRYEIKFGGASTLMACPPRNIPNNSNNELNLYRSTKYKFTNNFNTLSLMFDIKPDVSGYYEFVKQDVK